jgi:hypothetical protein
MTATVIDLLDSLRAHLSTFELPGPCSVHVMTYSDRSHVTMQLPRQEPTEIAAALLAWADTLTAVTARAWRDPTGDSMHLSIPDRVSIEVYGCLPSTEHDLGAGLAPAASKTVPLAILRERTTLGQVTP